MSGLYIRALRPHIQVSARAVHLKQNVGDCVDDPVAELQRFLESLLGMLAILLFLGCFMDQVSMMMITAPLFMPVAQQYGFDLVWFGVLMLMLLEIGLATPPFGLLLFVAKGASPNTSMSAIVASVAPFILMAIGVVALLIVFPGLTLLLPRMMAH